ncbi:MAG TPA: choice-of-anchor tandem repeat GloVer-containing protein [Rhizomicrobium sp.]|nr:choice-of-anchor tandem repeat GloVer-containing protein [Rhizomicrobium sp.]
MIVAAAFASMCASATAATLKTIYSFCRADLCRDGRSPAAPLLIDESGNLFGQTEAGGKGSGGVIFQFARGNSREQLLHAFCENPKNDTCKDGAQPGSRLIMDQTGDLYGTTESGGADFAGTVFELIPNADRSKWKIKVLHTFCSSCSDGSTPRGGLTYAGATSGALYDGVSPLYGATELGGANSHGTIFELDVVPGKTKRREKIIYSFCSQPNCMDGAAPGAGVIADAVGNVFGSAQAGGLQNWGILYEFTLDAKKKHWTETVLHNFCAAQDCADGAYFWNRTFYQREGPARRRRVQIGSQRHQLPVLGALHFLLPAELSGRRPADRRPCYG